MWKIAIFCVVCIFVELSQCQKITCNFLNTINITNGYHDGSGNFIHGSNVYKPGTFAEFTSITRILSNTTREVPVKAHIRGCIDTSKPHIRMCCFDDGAAACAKNDQILIEMENNKTVEIDLNEGRYGVLRNGLPCHDMFYAEDWELFDNGSLFLENDLKSLDSYCFTTDSLNVCYNKDDIEKPHYLKALSMVISIPFLIITFCVYGLIPELRNLHGKSLMCYIFGLTTLYISFIIIVLGNHALSTDTFTCSFIGYVAYVSVLLCFFWLNIMCYDIWSTFRGIRARGGERKRLIFYSLYAFGVPIFLTCILSVLDNTNIIPVAFRPRIGELTCWLINDTLVQFIYVYLPITIILIINITLYSITAHTIFRVQKETSVVRRGESQKHSKSDADKDRFFLYLRLFIIMGSTWSMEPISWMFKNATFLFYITDILNCLQGFLIFILFVWKKNVRKLVTKKYRSIRNFPAPQNSDSRATDTTKMTSLSTSLDKADKPLNP